MRFQRSTRLHLAFRFAAAAAALAAICIATASRAADSGQPNIAYDELTKFVRSDQPTPVPGTFSTDFQAAIAASTPAPQHHGMFGNIMNSVEQMKGAMSMFTTGTAMRYYYMNGWERTDTVATQQATITRPDRHQIIYLDLAKKTYRIVDTNTTPVTETPPPYQPPGPQGAPPPSPQPGTGKMDISVSITSLGAMTIDGVATSGFNQDFKLSETQSTGSCKDGSFETSMTEYLSSYMEPHLAVPKMPVHEQMPSAVPPQAMMGVHPGCSPKMTMHNSGGATPPAGRLAMWTLVTIQGAMQTTESGRGGGSFSTLIERGDVHTLGASDAALFDIPAGFTQEQQ